MIISLLLVKLVTVTSSAILIPDDCDENEKITNCSNDGNKTVQDEENDLDLGNEDDVLVNNVAVILATVIGDVRVIHPIT